MTTERLYLTLKLDQVEKELFSMKKRANGDIFGSSKLPNFKGWHISRHPSSEKYKTPIIHIADDNRRLGCRYHLTTTEAKDGCQLAQSLSLSDSSLAILPVFHRKKITDKIMLEIKENKVLSIQFVFGEKSAVENLFRELNPGQIHGLGLNRAGTHYNTETWLFECNNPAIGVVAFTGARGYWFDPFPKEANFREWQSRQMLVISNEGNPKYETLYKVTNN